MNGDKNLRIGEVSPRDAWGILNKDPNAALIDVRTRAEWAFVGIPDLRALPNPFLMVEWSVWPDMSVNPHFIDMVDEQFLGDTPETMLFICRSGVRSLYAADAVMTWLQRQGKQVDCMNVLTGFEGDRDERRHRGVKNGWKVDGLPWRQS